VADFCRSLYREETISLFFLNCLSRPVAIEATQGNAQIQQESTGSREIPAKNLWQGSLFLIRRDVHGTREASGAPWEQTNHTYISQIAQIDTRRILS